MWKNIIGFENYEINEQGQIRNKLTNKLKTIHLGKRGYYYVDIWKNNQSKRFYVHQLIAIHFIPKKNKDFNVVDHIDGNPLNNSISNLRWCFQGMNLINKKKKANTSSPYKGVCWDISRELWLGKIQYKRKQYNLGRFEQEKDCALAYNYFAVLIFGEFAVFNDVSFEEGSPDLMERLNDIQVRLNL